MATPEDQRHIARGQCSVALQAVLTDFQFMEEALRLYIESVYDLIRARLGGQVTFKLDYGSLEKDALGTLVHKFSQLSDKADLIKTLRDLTPKRNACAHKGFLASSYHSQDVADIDKYTQELEALKKETSACVDAVLAEGRAVDVLKAAGA